MKICTYDLLYVYITATVKFSSFSFSLKKKTKKQIC